jgi:F-type H+-transporting ATPase subunit epsilon
VTLLRPGIVTIMREGQREPVVVVGGFAEMGPGGLTVLADRAGSREDFDLQVLADDIRDTEEDVADCKEDAERDKLVRRLDQLRALQAALAS